MLIRRTLMLTAIVAATALGACKQPNGAVDGGTRAAMPGADAQARKAGLWEQKVSDGAGAQVTRLCLDAASHTAMFYLGESLNKDLCKSHTMTRRADGSWAFESVCTAGGAQVTSKGVATGDFNAAYQIKVEQTTLGAAGSPPGTPQRFVVDAAWKGPCPAGMKPGDIVLSDGRKVTAAALKVNAPS
jgi:hypothetical protein